MINEFKKFIARGNVIDLAVGVIIGGAFGKIVTSVVSDIIMPLLGLVTVRSNFGNMFIFLKKPPDGAIITTVEEAIAANIPTLNYGLLISNMIDFLIIAAVVFFLVRGINRLSEAKNILPVIGRKPPPEPPDTKECPYCMSIINIKAARCPHCTSELGGKENE